MKFNLSLLIIIVSSIFFGGCYTVLWNPNLQMPETSEYSEEESYYIDRFVPYYDTPWWNNYSLPTISEETTKNRNNSTERDGNSLRDNGSINRNVSPRVYDQTTPRPTVNESGNTNNNSGSKQDGYKKTTENSDSNSNSRTNTNSNSGSNSSGSQNRDTRNNDSQRNSGGRR